MDGDARGSGGIAVFDGGTGDEAVTSGDVAPAPVDGEPESTVGAPAVEAAVESEGAGPGGVARADEVDEAAEAPGRAPEEAGASGGPVVEDLGSPEPGTDEPAVAGAPDGPGPGEHAPAEAGAPAVEDGAVEDGAVEDGAVEDGAVEDGAVEDGAVEDGAEYVPTGTEVAGSVPAESVPGESVPAESVPPGTGPQAGRRRYGPYVRRGVVALLAAGLVALGVGAFAWAAPSPEAANQRFVDAAQSQGHVLAPGEQETLVISAARKICDRRTTHETDQERRATALNSDEIAAVGTAFGADTRAFTTLALKTFCSR